MYQRVSILLPYKEMHFARVPPYLFHLVSSIEAVDRLLDELRLINVSPHRTDWPLRCHHFSSIILAKRWSILVVGFYNYNLMAECRYFRTGLPG